MVELHRKRESHQQKSKNHESPDGQASLPQRWGHSDSPVSVQQVWQSQLWQLNSVSLSELTNLSCHIYRRGRRGNGNKDSSLIPRNYSLNNRKLDTAVLEISIKGTVDLHILFSTTG